MTWIISNASADWDVSGISHVRFPLVFFLPSLPLRTHSHFSPLCPVPVINDVLLNQCQKHARVREAGLLRQSNKKSVSSVIFSRKNRVISRDVDEQAEINTSKELERIKRQLDKEKRKNQRLAEKMPQGNLYFRPQKPYLTVLA